MKLFQIIANAQDGHTFANMGQAYGLDEDIVAQIVRYFAPAIAKAVEKRGQTAEGLLSLLEFLGSRRFDRFLNDERIFGHGQVTSEGERVLQFLFGHPQRIQKIIENRAKVLPIDSTELRKLFPVIAILAIGAIEIRTRKPLGSLLHHLTQGTADSQAVANPYIILAQHLKKLEREEKEKRKKRLFPFFGSSSSSAAIGGGSSQLDAQPILTTPQPAT